MNKCKLSRDSVTFLTPALQTNSSSFSVFATIWSQSAAPGLKTTAAFQKNSCPKKFPPLYYTFSSDNFGILIKIKYILNYRNWLSSEMVGVRNRRVKYFFCAIFLSSSTNHKTKSFNIF